jgi:hypothetical protein
MFIVSLQKQCQSSIGATCSTVDSLGHKASAGFDISDPSDYSSAACAAANRAMGIRKGLQLT